MRRSVMRLRSFGIALCGAMVTLLWACEGQNLFGPGATAPPDVTIHEPGEGAGLPLTDSVLVEVTVRPALATTPAPIESVRIDGVSFVGDEELGTRQEVTRFETREVTFEEPSPTPATVRRYLQPTGGAEPGPAFIRVTATDQRGNEGTDSVRVELGAPSIRFLSPSDGDPVGRGMPLTIDVEAADRAGVASLEVTAGEEGLPLLDLPIDTTYSPAEDTARLSATVTLPDETGTVEFFARSVNTQGIEAVVGPITVNVVDDAQTDETPPELRVSFQPGGSSSDGNRLELTDELTFVVEGRDQPGGFGVAEAGVTVFASPRRRSTSERVVPVQSTTYSPARGGTFPTEIRIPLGELAELGPASDPTLDLREAPDTVDLAFVAYMVDAQGNCAAATSSEEFQSLECATSPEGVTIAADNGAQTAFVVGVSGQTVSLPDGGAIADAVVDTARNLLVLSNIERSRLEVFDLDSRTFESASILVGSEPWGMTFSRTDPDTLYVGNSGGTNISVVDMAGRREDVPRRILTPNALLFDVRENVNDQGAVTLSAEFHDFSDRLQFIAQDRNGSLVYSTLPTPAAGAGTIRLAISGPGGGDTEVVLYTEHASLEEEEQSTAIGNVDDIDLIADVNGFSDGIRIRDHVVGSTSSVVETTVVDEDGFAVTPGQALAELVARPDVYAEGGPGVWSVGQIGLSDTTFVAASGDGSLVAIGEGATGPTGRVILYRAPNLPAGAIAADYIGGVSGEVEVVDLVGNAAERVLGVALNYDGTMGAARGEQAVYFFDSQLRDQGQVGVSQGGTGVALHPLHQDGPVNTNVNASFAFAGTGDRTVEVFDTRHFSRIGTISIRERIVGQIRALLPTDADQPPGVASCLDAGQEVSLGIGRAKRIFIPGTDGQQLNPALADECVVMKLTGVTEGGGVVVVDVTKADVTRDHPDR